MLLSAEANGVIALRMMKLMRGGRSARRSQFNCQRKDNRDYRSYRKV